MRRLRLFALATLLTTAVGCGGDIEAQYLERQKNEAPMVNDDLKVEAMNPGPYHIAIRYGEATMTLLVKEALTTRIANGDLGGSSMGSDSPMGGKIEVGPLSLVSCDADFPKDKEGIFLAKVKLKGELKVKTEPGKMLRKLRGEQAPTQTKSVAIAPEVVVAVRMKAGEADGRPALLVDVVSLNSFSLNPEKPLPIPALQAKIQESIRKKVEATLVDKAANPDAHKVQILPERLGKGDSPVKLLGAGVTLIPGPGGEMFLGFVTNLNTPAQITAESRGLPLENYAWGMTLGDNVLTLMLKAAAKQGKIPLRYTRKGEKDPEGRVIVEIERAQLTPEGFIFHSRIWNLDFPSFWKAYQIKGQLTASEGQIRPQIQSMEGGEGEGNTWVGKFIEDKQKEAPATTVRDAGRTEPRTMPLPMTGGKRSLQLIMENVATTDGALTIRGSSTVVDTPPEK